MLFALALVFIGVMGVYRMGVREGYGQAWMQTQAQPREDETPAPSAAPYGAPFGLWGRPFYRGYWPMHRGPRLFGHLGRLFSFMLSLLLIGAIAKALMFKAWRLHRAGANGKPPKGGAHPHAHWGHGPWGRGPWGHGPPCCWGADEDGEDEPDTDEQVAKVQGEPDAG
jgi:hypothetical protein